MEGNKHAGQDQIRCPKTVDFDPAADAYESFRESLERDNAKAVPTNQDEHQPAPGAAYEEFLDGSCY